jgi:hypothetical protein
VVSRVSCNTEPRTPNSDSPPPVSTSGAAYALTLVSLSFDREIVIREFTFPDAQGHGPYKTPNPDSSGSCATCTLSDQRLRSIRGIATRDFSRCNLLPRQLPNSEPLKPDGPLSFPVCACGLSPCATPPRSDGPRDFTKLHLDHKSLILFLLRILRLPIFSLVQSLPACS